ncbi:PhzF family phenazine biosynthesis protein [Muriicola soli]|uniref:PhzF family phenazine biosynthesis protein n=1 Tax=Muriicola soli TaxID=2507538 RepID=A0A411ECR6_9FLAO|nr:PhzF family phenazine biosynthesis protein [Muriicola soli]QBA65479.1 PhzF family phenazine biosynthesis protein [Muriicola soli]
MKTLKLYQIDAFAEKLFTGNPAAVCVLDSWLDEDLMQKIAMENNLAETAFVVHSGDQYQIRWFTPELEVDLCGHATLASAYVLFQYYNHESDLIRFQSERSGHLTVRREASGELTLDFPVDQLKEVPINEEITIALGAEPLSMYKGKTDYVLIYRNQEEITSMQPNFFLLDKIDARGIIVTAPGNEVDFVSRFFAPSCGIPEDPVTGSAHTSLTPYWAKSLGKENMLAKQLSQRGGTLKCALRGDRVLITGKAKPYLRGEIML